MDGVSVAELKRFVKAAGGAHGPDTWAQLVHPDVQDDFEEVVEDANTSASTWPTCNQRAILTPLSVFQSATIISLATATGQDYRKFGVDEQTPSGVQHDSAKQQTSRPLGEGVVECGECGKRSSKSGLARHRCRPRTRCLRCPICNKLFNSPSSLARHQARCTEQSSNQQTVV